MEYAVRGNIIAKNPCTEVSVKYSPREKRALTDEEKDLITKNIDKLQPRQKIYLLLLRYTGMRKGEVLALSKNDIDRDKMIITINKTLVQDAGLPFVQDLTKSKAGVRKIPIFLPLIKPLFDYLDNLKGNDLFTTNTGKYISISQLSVWTSQIKNRIGLNDDITNHSLRHNFISECYHAKIDLKKLQKWVGHADISTTLNIYTHLAEEEAEKSDEMNDFYSSQMEVKNEKQDNLEPLKLVK
jgi:integrase